MQEKKKKLIDIFRKDRQAKKKESVFENVNNVKESYIKEGNTVLLKTPKEKKAINTVQF